MTVTVYSKPACVQCKATMRHLDSNNIDYNIIDLSTNPAALTAVKELGYLQAPVIVTPDAHWSGYQPDKIDEIALQMQVA